MIDIVKHTWVVVREVMQPEDHWDVSLFRQPDHFLGNRVSAVGQQHIGSKISEHSLERGQHRLGFTRPPLVNSLTLRAEHGDGNDE